MIEEILKKRGHSNPKKGSEAVKMQDPFERGRVIYKDLTAVSAMANAFREDIERDIKNLREAVVDGEVDWDPSDVDEYISKARAIERDLQSGKEGSISAVHELYKWSHDHFDPGWGGNFASSDIYPKFEEIVGKYLGETYYPDDFRGL